MYQQITIIGNVGRDPELRFTPQGVAVCDFSVAVNKRVGGGQNGTEARDETTWFRVTCWRQLAETVAKYVKKGRQLMVVGEVSASSYTDKAGQPAVTLEITAQTVKFLGTRDENEDGGNSGGGQRYQENDFRPPSQEQAGGRSGGGNRSGGRGRQAPPENSDDIPF